MKTRVADLVPTGQSCQVRCTRCGKDFKMSSLEALASFGGLLRFDEVQTVMRGRCSSEDCGLTIGPSSVFTAADRQSGPPAKRMPR